MPALREVEEYRAERRNASQPVVKLEEASGEDDEGNEGGGDLPLVG